jgi:ATP-binding cassette subfamily B protein
MSTASAALPKEKISAKLSDAVRPRRRALLIIAVLVTASALFELVPPLLIRWIVDDHLTIGRPEGLALLAALYLAATALGQVLAFAYGYLAAHVAQGVLSGLRVQLFGHYQRLPAAYFDRTPLGDAISRCTSDVDTLDTVFTSGVAALVANLVRLITIGCAMLLLSPMLSLAAAIALPPLVILTRYFQLRIRDAERANRRAVAEMNTHLQDSLRGVEVIQAFRSESHFVARFRQVLLRLLKASNRSTLYSSFYPPVTALMTYALIAFLLWTGTREAFADFGVTIGTLTAFSLLLQRFFTPLTALGDEWQTVQGALSGAERIVEVLRLPLDEQHERMPRRQPTQGIHLDEVTFGYVPGVPVLHRVSLDVAPGEHVALVGRTGAGKSSIVQLLAGMYEPWQGNILIAGRAPRFIADQERRRLCGIVPQSVQLFSASIMENLTLNDAAIDAAAVIDAATISGADQFIRALPEGYHTLLRGAGRGRGVQLSAGQEQLLALTRALVARPAVLLFDEATSLIDSTSEAELRHALREHVLARGTAILTVAHRLANAREADRVIVLDGGRIIEDGAPAELVARAGRFAALLELEAAGWEWR